MNAVTCDKRRRLRALCLAPALLLAACSNGELADLQEYVSQTRERFQGNVEPLPAVEPYYSYRYTSAKRRDPFRPSISLIKSIQMARQESGIKPDGAREKEELERYSLDALSMVGIMVNNGETWAIIRAPDGTIFRVRPGNYMGHNHGKITSINETTVELREIITDGTGHWSERANQLSLSQ